MDQSVFAMAEGFCLYRDYSGDFVRADCEALEIHTDVSILVT